MPAPVITSYCIIRNRQIVRDGEVIFRGKQANINDFLQEAYDWLRPDYPKFYKMDNLSRLGFLAAEVLIGSRSLAKEYSSEKIAVVLSNASSSLDTDIRYQESSKAAPSPALFVYTLPNIVAGEICIRHKLKGENAFFISPQFDAELMAMYVSAIFSPRSSLSDHSREKRYASSQACIAGWVEALGEHHDVFLYLLEESSQDSLMNSAETLKELYHSRYGTIDGQSEKTDH